MVQEKTLLDVLSDIEKIANEKLDAEQEYFAKKQVLPKGIHIAGIDLTRNGENLTHKEFKQHQKKATILNTHREALRLAVAHWNALVMPKAIFDKLRLELGLFCLYPSAHDNLYIIKNKKWITEMDDLKKAWWSSNENTNVSGLLLANMIQFFFVFTFVGFISYFYSNATSFLSYMGNTLFISGLLVLTGAFLRYTYFGYRCIKIQEEMAVHRKSLRKMFPDFTLYADESSTLISAWAKKDHDLAKISLPQPPQNVVKIMEDVHKKLSKKKRFQIVTVADELSIGLDVQERNRPKPEPVTPPQELDPGLVIEYGTYVAILPDSFYNITEVEQTFIDRSLEVAEKWDARAYVFN